MADAARELLAGIADGRARLSPPGAIQGIGERRERIFEICSQDMIAEAGQRTSQEIVRLLLQLRR